jgi:hypothetical protein
LGVGKFSQRFESLYDMTSKPCLTPLTLTNMMCCLTFSGGGLGLFMGMLLAALETPPNVDQMSAKEQFLFTARQMGSRSLSTAKAFAIMGAIFSGTECMVEKVC